MSFFVKPLFSIKYNILSQSEKVRFQKKYHSKKAHIRKRTSPFIFWENASLTVEAAVVLPLFLAACMVVLFFAELFRLETRVDELLFNYSKVYAQYAGLLQDYEISENVFFDVGLKGFGVYGVSQAFNEELGKEFNDKFMMAGGILSYSFGYSEIDENYIDLIVVYRVRFNVPFISLPKIPIVQRCRFHAWSGSEKKPDADNDDVIVYITPTGEVYHRDRDCTYIKLSVSSVRFDDVSSKRNNGGAKYYSCEKCVKDNNVNKVVYITENGTRYHNSLNCSELKRTVKEVKLSEVKDSKRPCSKCGM